MLAVAESWENGKPVRETLNADIPLAIDHFRYFAGAIRAEEGRISEIDKDTIAYHFHERSAWSARSSRSTSRC
jgi:aldehyde dehydrogenase